MEKSHPIRMAFSFRFLIKIACGIMIHIYPKILTVGDACPYKLVCMALGSIRARGCHAPCKLLDNLFLFCYNKARIDVS